MTAPVNPDGPPDAEIICLGEAPGKEEAEESRPFVGPSGRLLYDQILARAGIRREHTLALYTHWEMPSGRKWETIGSLGKYDESTLKTIGAHPRKVIIAIGEHALSFLMQGSAKATNRLEIIKWRGSMLTQNRFAANVQAALASTGSAPTIAVPMIHPESVMRSGEYDEAGIGDDSGADRKGLHYRSLCEHDAKRIKQIVEGKIETPPERQVMHAGNCSYSAIDMALENLLNENGNTPIAFDIETFSHTITCIGVASSGTDAVVVPLTEVSWTRSQQVRLIELIADVLDGPAPKIGQHLDYDVQHLAQIGIPVRNVWLDTAIAHSILHPEIPHDLAMLTSLYTLEPYFKDMREDKEVDESTYGAQHWRYNGLDCCVTWEVGMKLDWEMRQ